MEYPRSLLFIPLSCFPRLSQVSCILFELSAWSKLGAVSNPWGSPSSESVEESWNPNNSTDWANFEENFGDSDPTKKGDAESRSTLATNVEQHYRLFGNALNEESGIISNFAACKISNSGREMDSQFDNRAELMNGEWTDANGADKDESQSDAYAMQQNYSCFVGQEMLHLESISGNTLAEKIANAENDIRNKDEIRLRGMQGGQPANNDNFEMMNSFGEAGDQNTSNVECVIKVRVDGSDEIADEEKLNEPNSAFPSQQDCLTENSVDFVTADNNSTSDAESSVEFGDAENSLELEVEEEFVERADDSPTESVVVGDCNACSEQVAATVDAENVPKVGKISDECNNVQSCEEVVQKENSVSSRSSSPIAQTCVERSSIESKSCPLVNGDVAEHEMLTNCGK